MKNSNWRAWLQTLLGTNACQSNCNRGKREKQSVLPPDPNLGTVQYIAPHTRGTEKRGSDHEWVEGSFKPQDM